MFTGRAGAPHGAAYWAATGPEQAYRRSPMGMSVGENKGGAMMMGGGMHMGHRCPKGQHWVKGYNKKNGTKVKGYCR